MNRPTEPSAAVSRTVGRILVEGSRTQQGAELPVVVLEGATPGPTAVITANLHGDETTGVGVVRRLDTLLQGASFRGRVVLYPSCNPQGLRAQTRHVPNDETDLNRAFPGSARGSWAARIAAALWADLERRAPAVVVDLHADAPTALPYVIVDRPVRKHGAARRRLADEVLALARATGLTVLREYPDDVYVQFGLDKSLAGAVVNLLGVPAVTLEVGPRRQLDPVAVDVAFEATLGVLGKAGVLDHPTVDHPTRVDGAWRRAATPRTRRGGLVETVVPVGATFARGDVIARLVGLAGEPIEDVRATDPGLLVSWVEHAWVSAGGLLGTLGIPDVERL